MKFLGLSVPEEKTIAKSYCFDVLHYSGFIGDLKFSH